MRQLQKIDYSHFVIPLVKDPTEIHVLGVSSDKCSPVKSRGGMKDHLKYIFLCIKMATSWYWNYYYYRYRHMSNF